MNITELTVHELQKKLESKELTITEIAEAYANRIEEKEKDVDAFVTIQANEAIEKAKEIEEKIARGEIKSQYAGIKNIYINILGYSSKATPKTTR